jgi:hypothetical protein
MDDEEEEEEEEEEERKSVIRDVSWLLLEHNNPLKKVLANGEGGAVRMALTAAREAGLETGGMVKKGFCDKGLEHTRFALMYGLKEGESSSIFYATIQNIDDSDAVLAFRVFNEEYENLENEIGYAMTKEWKNVFSSERELPNPTFKPVLIISIPLTRDFQEGDVNKMSFKQKKEWDVQALRIYKFLYKNKVKVLTILGHVHNEHDKKWETRVFNFMRHVIPGI